MRALKQHPTWKQNNYRMKLLNITDLDMPLFASADDKHTQVHTCTKNLPPLKLEFYGRSKISRKRVRESLNTILLKSGIYHVANIFTYPHTCSNCTCMYINCSQRPSI